MDKPATVNHLLKCFLHPCSFLFMSYYHHWLSMLYNYLYIVYYISAWTCNNLILIVKFSFGGSRLSHDLDIESRTFLLWGDSVNHIWKLNFSSNLYLYVLFLSVVCDMVFILFAFLTWVPLILWDVLITRSLPAFSFSWSLNFLRFAFLLHLVFHLLTEAT